MLNPEIAKRFIHHAPKDDQPVRYQFMRQKARELAEHFDEHCPDSREKALAMTKLEEAVFWANASIARNE
jgi:ribosomal protein S15P/S13E